MGEQIFLERFLWFDQQLRQSLYPNAAQLAAFRSRSLTQVTIRGSELSQLLLPGLSGDSLSQKWPTASFSYRSRL